MQTDPVGYEDQMNLYAYVHNDPLNYTDPTGEAACGGICVGTGIAATWLYRAYKAHKIARNAAAATAAAAAANELYSESGRPSDGMPIREGAEVERPGQTGSRDEILVKPGTVDDANADFDNNVDPETVTDRGNGMRTGKTHDGANITVRPGSKSGEPTVEVTTGSGRNRDTDKIRYREDLLRRNQ